MNKKRVAGAALASALLFAPLTLQSATALADSFYTSQTNAERADITNWVANTSQEISNNLSSQHIDVNNLHGDQYVIQWGDTLSGISSATGISVAKLAYDNHIQNIDLIYAGDVLVLNRDGEVPSDWSYEGDGNYVAKTKVTINNFTDNSDHSVNIDVSPVSNKHVDNSDNSVKNEYESPKDPQPDADDKSSSSSSDNASKESSEDADQLDETDFSDAIQDEIKDKLNLDDDQLTVDFTGKDADDESEDADSTDDDVDTDSDSDSDSDTDTLYEDDQTVSIGSDQLTEKNAKKLADKIVAQLKDDDKDKDVTDADEIELTITADDGDFTFNVSLTSDDDSDSDDTADTDDEDSSDVDSESSDDEDADSSEDEDSNEDDSDTDSDEDSDSQDDESDEDEDSNQAVDTNADVEDDDVE
ncbi:LysM peptidoglycan-binding domain-containing protein [Pediococcus acidilactici]